MMWGYGWDMGWMWLFVPLTVVGIVLLVLLAVRLFGSASGRGGAISGSAQGKTPARLILDERFAKGELTADEYRQQLQVLGER